MQMQADEGYAYLFDGRKKKDGSSSLPLIYT
jgi:hypothetical protein